jgi:hypothetical protein
MTTCVREGCLHPVEMKVSEVLCRTHVLEALGPGPTDGDLACLVAAVRAALPGVEPLESLEDAVLALLTVHARQRKVVRHERRRAETAEKERDDLRDQMRAVAVKLDMQDAPDGPTVFNRLRLQGQRTQRLVEARRVAEARVAELSATLRSSAQAGAPRKSQITA